MQRGFVGGQLTAVLIAGAEYQVEQCDGRQKAYMRAPEAHPQRAAISRGRAGKGRLGSSHELRVAEGFVLLLAITCLRVSVNLSGRVACPAVTALLATAACTLPVGGEQLREVHAYHALVAATGATAVMHQATNAHPHACAAASTQLTSCMHAALSRKCCIMHGVVSRRLSREG
jgi:hypothetical protein